MIMEILNKIIAVSVGLLVLALLFPIALNTLANATMTNVDPTVVTVVTILVPVLAAIGVALYFLPSIRD
jgi:drug/metabolite transporter (DMT)-like permease